MRAVSILAVLALLLSSLTTAFAAPDASEIIERADAAVFGKRSLQGEFEMTVVTPAWSRRMVVKAWVERPGKTFTRVVYPAKDAGMGSLSIAPEMWNYVPSIERTIKIPPSLMLQAWFGSDFTNEDMMMQGSVVTNYVHRLVGEKMVDGSPAYEVELLPKREAPVAWGRIVSLIRKADYIPLNDRFYDERGTLVRQMVYSEIREIGGRMRPTRMEMVPTNPPGKRTVLSIKSLVVDQPIDPSIFSLQNLTRKQ